MLVHNSSHITVIEIASRAGLSKSGSLFLSCRHCHFNGWLLDFAGSVWCAYDSKPTLACRCQTAPKMTSPLNSSEYSDRLAALRDSSFSLLIFQVLLYYCLFAALFSSYSALASVWKLGVYHVFTYMIALNSNFISMSCSASNSSALNPACCSPHG